MKKFLLSLVCGVAILFSVTVIRACQQGPLELAMREWADQAEPVDASKTKSDYDPAEVSRVEIKTLELKIKDAQRGREIPVLVYLPNRSEAAEVVLYSHGLGGSRETSPFLGKHWAARGYVAVFMQHPGSDVSVWQDIPRRQRLRAFKKAANAENLQLRVVDVPTVIDALENWNVQDEHPLNGRLDLEKVGMSGHSFGAVTTQHVAGQVSFGKSKCRDDRITACIAMSPSAPRSGSVAKAVGGIEIPCLCMTGTQDRSIIGGADVENRLSVYPALPAKDKFELVLFEATHAAFVASKFAGDAAKRNPNHHPAIKATSTAFWDAFLREDAKAKAWLTSQSVRSVLETKDRWQYK